MSTDGISVDITLTSGSGKVKARANVRIELDEGSLVVFGFPVIEQDGKPAWVGSPSKAGKTPGKYFPTFQAEGKIHKSIVEAIPEAYRTATA